MLYNQVLPTVRQSSSIFALVVPFLDLFLYLFACERVEYSGFTVYAFPIAFLGSEPGNPTC
jgi:hypothetical protein